MAGGSGPASYRTRQNVPGGQNFQELLAGQSEERSSSAQPRPAMPLSSQVLGILQGGGSSRTASSAGDGSKTEQTAATNPPAAVPDHAAVQAGLAQLGLADVAPAPTEAMLAAAAGRLTGAGSRSAALAAEHAALGGGSSASASASSSASDASKTEQRAASDDSFDQAAVQSKLAELNLSDVASAPTEAMLAAAAGRLTGAGSLQAAIAAERAAFAS
jgi:hypothetical protein